MLRDIPGVLAPRFKPFLCLTTESAMLVTPAGQALFYPYFPKPMSPCFSLRLSSPSLQPYLAWVIDDQLAERQTLEVSIHVLVSGG